jgi:hypothetical protein
MRQTALSEGGLCNQSDLQSRLSLISLTASLSHYHNYCIMLQILLFRLLYLISIATTVFPTGSHFENKRLHARDRAIKMNIATAVGHLHL